jgi:hypothetical protein
MKILGLFLPCGNLLFPLLDQMNSRPKEKPIQDKKQEQKLYDLNHNGKVYINHGTIPRELGTPIHWSKLYGLKSQR